MHHGARSSEFNDSAATAVSEALGGALKSSAAARTVRKPKPQAASGTRPTGGTSSLQQPFHHCQVPDAGARVFRRTGEVPAAPSLAGLHHTRLPSHVPGTNATPLQRAQQPATGRRGIPATAAKDSGSSQPRGVNDTPTPSRTRHTVAANALSRGPPPPATLAAASTRSPSVVKIDIPPLLTNEDAEPPLTTHTPSSSATSNSSQTELRRRKSIQRPAMAAPEMAAAGSTDTGGGVQPPDSRLNKPAPAPAATATRSPTSAALHYTSAFLRRKQQFLHSDPSPRAAPHSYSNAAAVTTTDSRFSSSRLFFQDASESSEQSQSRPPSQATSSSTGAELELSSIALDTELENGASTARPPKTTRKPSGFARKAPHRDRHSQLQLERLGDLSREEDEFDFAILLTPSKYEEHLEMPSSDDPSLPPSSTIQQQLDVHRTETLSVLPKVTSELPSHHHLRRDLKVQKDPTRARNLIIARIQSTGLQVKRLLSLDGRQTLLKVKAPQHVLELGAERMKLRKLRRFDQIWMAFSRELRTTFADFDEGSGNVRFIDSEKQSIVHSLLTTNVSTSQAMGGWESVANSSLGAGLNEFCPLKTKYVVQMFPLHKQDLSALKRHWVTYWREPSLNDLSSGSDPKSKSSSSCGHRLACEALSQPIDQVAQYFGEKVAFYFAWMEMYTRWLIVPSIVGLVLFCLQVSSQRIDHPLAPLYAMFMALWTSAFLLAWKRRAAALAYRWGTLGYEDDAEATRPEFYGDPKLSTPLIKQYPAWKRYLKYVVTIPTVLGSMALTLAITFWAFSTRDKLERSSLETKARAKHLAQDISADLEHGLTLENLKRVSALGLDWQFWFYFLITPMLYGLLIPVLDYIFTRWARFMTNWENHRTTSRYHSHLILKVFSFRFVHVFASLYYYAFVDYARRDNLLRVAIQLASFMVAGQLWKNVMETLYPFVRRRWLAAKKKRLTNAQFSNSTVFNTTGGGPSGAHRRRSDAVMMARSAGRMAGNAAANGNATTSNAVIHEQCVRLEQASDKAWEEAALSAYDTFEDYAEMLIQFGYVSFFSLAFPLAPLLALANNVLELRTDAFKLCHAKQRPLAHKASGIGIWLHVLQLMSVLAVLTNCLHIAFTTTLLEQLFPDSLVTSTTKVWLAFGVEHLLLLLKVWMMIAIPDMPRDVQDKVRREREQAKQESARAMAAKMLLEAATASANAAATNEEPDEAER